MLNAAQKKQFKVCFHLLSMPNSFYSYIFSFEYASGKCRQCLKLFEKTPISKDCPFSQSFLFYPTNVSLQPKEELILISLQH